GLDDALGATPSARLRVVARVDGEGVIGYAITGRAGSRGYLQRLAVDPAAQRRGIGAALVIDGLRWLRRWGAHEVLVNTQVDNGAALALYEAMGFRRQPDGLAVLRRDLDTAES
ncbi:MAG: GNAT family N-acetyltransferase, partial [Acidimicrobiales bacterium]